MRQSRQVSNAVAADAATPQVKKSSFVPYPNVVEVRSSPYNDADR